MFILVSIALLSALYIISSIVLFNCPNLLHKKRRLKFPPCRHISHRGGAGERLENTLEAFRHAVEGCKTDMLELDCHLTKDGYVVVAHDVDLNRICDDDRFICDTNYKDLPLLQTPLKVQFSKDRRVSVVGEDRKISLLSEVFDQFPGIPINLDVKDNSQELIQKVSDMIIRYDREDITPWGNHRDEVTRACYRQNPRIPLVFSLRRCVYLYLFYYTGLLPFISFKESCLELLMPATIHKYLQNPTTKQRLLIRVLDWLWMSRRLFTHMQARGIHVYLWVLNETEEYEAALRLKVDGIMTDYPTKLRKFLQNQDTRELIS